MNQSAPALRTVFLDRDGILNDIEFGRGLGMRTVFVEGDRERQKPGAETAADLADLRCGSLGEAVEIILSIGSRKFC